LSHLQLNDAIVKGSTNPRPHRVKGKPLDTSRLALKLGQHGARGAFRASLLSPCYAAAQILGHEFNPNLTVVFKESGSDRQTNRETWQRWRAAEQL